MAVEAKSVRVRLVSLYPSPQKVVPWLLERYMTVLGLFSFQHDDLILSLDNFPRRTVDFGRLRRPTRFVAQLRDWHNAIGLSLYF